MGDNSDILDDDYVFMDSESDNETRQLPSPGPVKAHRSDSNLTLRNKVTNGASNIQKLRFKDIRLSDSKLYKRSIGRDLDHKRSSLTFRIGDGSSQSLRDDVFEEEHVEDKKAKKADDPVVNAPNDVKTDGSKVVENGLDRSDSIKQVQDLTLKEQQVFYAGENGRIIVPKIVLEGEDMFTTFEHIDVSQDTEQSSPKVDLDSYQDKVVAIEIAKEMAKLDKLENLQVTQSVSDESIADTFAKDLNMVKTEMNGKIPSPKLTAKQPASQFSETIATVNKGGFKLTRFGQNNVPHVGASLPYEQLKSSIPDYRISFHSESHEVIYINEQDEFTKL